jgi:hypothetical protein
VRFRCLPHAFLEMHGHARPRVGASPRLPDFTVHATQPRGTRAFAPRSRAAPLGSRSKDPAGMVLPALRDAPPFVYAAGGVGPTIGGESRLHRPAWSVVISRSPTHQRERHTCPPARQLGHCPRSTYAAAAPHLAQPQLKTCSFPRFSCTRKRINLPRTKCELAVVKFDLLMCV